MTAAISAKRADEFHIEVLPESDFAVEPTWTTPLAASVASFDTSSAIPSAIPDPSIKIDGGEHPEIPGLVVDDANCPLSMKAEGIGAIPEVAAAPAHTALSRLLETVFGAAAQPLKRSLTSGSPSTTSVVETVDDGHKPASGYGFASFLTSRGREARPLTYTDVTDTMALPVALSAAPAGGADVGGGILFQYANRPSAPPTVSIRQVGQDAAQCNSLHGCVASLECPEVGPGAVPMLNFKIRAAKSLHDQSGWTKTIPVNGIGRVLAGSEVLIAKVGATAFYRYPYQRMGFAIGSDWEPVSDGTPDVGAAGWSRADGLAGYVDLTLLHDSDPDSALGGSAYSSWLDFWEDNLGEQFQVIVNVGRMVSGHGFTAYFPRAHILRPQRATVGRIDSRKIRFVPSALTQADYTAGLVHEVLGWLW